MNVFVTGGAGYIGSVTVKKLLDEGHRVTVFDSLEKGYRPAVDRRAQLIEADLNSLEAVRAALASANFDAVIHFAGYIESGESMKDPLRFFKNNYSAGLNLLLSMQELKLVNFIFSSTAGVYGDGQPPLGEESPISPTSFYSLSKYQFEQVLSAASQAGGFRIVVLRYFNAAGALADGSLGENHQPETHLIPLVIRTALGLAPEFLLYGQDYPTADGTAVRDYIHVEDLASAHILSLKRFSSSAAFFEVYNVGSGKGFSNREIINQVKEVSGVDFKVTPKPRRAGDWAVAFADSTKIRSRLGWRAQHGLRQIIESAFLWHQKHPYGFSQK